MKASSILSNERTTKLGNIGEHLAEECLRQKGFTDVENLNRKWGNYPYADLVARRGTTKYFIGVKARNEFMANGEINFAYNLVLIRDAQNREFKRAGKTTDQITRILIDQTFSLAAKWDAIPAWIAVALRPERGTYSIYFGLLSALGMRRSIPMLLENRRNYEVLVEHLADYRVTSDLLNRQVSSQSSVL